MSVESTDTYGLLVTKCQQGLRQAGDYARRFQQMKVTMGALAEALEKAKNAMEVPSHKEWKQLTGPEQEERLLQAKKMVAVIERCSAFAGPSMDEERRMFKSLLREILEIGR